MAANKPRRARTGRPSTARISAAVAYLMRAGKEFADVIKWMQAQEKNEREDDRTPRKRTQLLYTERGEKIELYRDVVKRLKQK